MKFDISFVVKWNGLFKGGYNEGIIMTFYDMEMLYRHTNLENHFSQCKHMKCNYERRTPSSKGVIRVFHHHLEQQQPQMQMFGDNPDNLLLLPNYGSLELIHLACARRLDPNHSIHHRLVTIHWLEA